MNWFKGFKLRMALYVPLGFRRRKILDIGWYKRMIPLTRVNKAGTRG